jgi:DNA helicase TIP49 (TBP-interacting protein)
VQDVTLKDVQITNAKQEGMIEGVQNLKKENVSVKLRGK